MKHYLHASQGLCCQQPAAIAATLSFLQHVLHIKSRSTDLNRIFQTSVIGVSHVVICDDLQETTRRSFQHKSLKTTELESCFQHVAVILYDVFKSLTTSYHLLLCYLLDADLSPFRMQLHRETSDSRG